MKKDPLLSNALSSGSYNPQLVGRTIGSVQRILPPPYRHTDNLDVQPPGTPPLGIPHDPMEVSMNPAVWRLSGRKA